MPTLAYLLDCITHLLEMSLLVEMTGHLLGQQGFYHIGSTKNDATAQELHYT